MKKINDISINSILLPLSGEWELIENSESNKVWDNYLSGDKLTLNFFSVKPDLPEETTDIHPIRIS